MSYPGGKAGSGTYQKIINLMPPHTTYVEPFLGDGAIMRAKRPAQFNIARDLDPTAPGLTMAADTGAPSDGGRRPPTFPTRYDRMLWDILPGDAFTLLEWLAASDVGPEVLVYCDPPYMHETRSSKNLYNFELSDVHHRQLLRVLRRLKCRVMLSGYWSQTYADQLRDWNSIHFEAMTRGGIRTEWLWFNFDPPTELHDYRFLGADFRERERIKRKTARWKNRLSKMPMLERQALLAAIADTAATGDGRPEVK